DRMIPLFVPLRCLRLVCLLSLAAVLSPVVSAEEKARDAEMIYPRPAEARAEAVAGRGSGYNGVLLVALLLAGAGGWLFWRGRAVPGTQLNARKLAIAETKSLGNRQYLVVASYEDKKFLLSVCPGRIELLTTLEAAAQPVAKLP